MLNVALTQRLGDFDLDARFDVPSGLTVLFGPSGTGKTSVLRGVAGLSRGATGHVQLSGTDLHLLPPRARRIGYVFQDARLFPHMTVLQNLRYGGAQDEGRIIEMLGLEPLLSRSPRHLSGGEAQRVAIGRALMSAPQLLLLDEPLASLDAARKSEIMPYLERIRDDARVPILYVTHDMSEVVRLATTLVVMRQGRVVQSGPVQDVLSDPAAIPDIGAEVAGAVLTAVVTDEDAGDGLCALDIGGPTLLVPGNLGPTGAHVRLRVPARDVILSRDAPDGLSALNILQATVTAIAPGSGPYVDVGLKAGQARLLARITRRSADRLALGVGGPIHAIVKATAVGHRD